MPQELYSATVAPDSDGTERLWLGDSGDPYYLTLNRLFYKNAAGRMFTDLAVNIDNGTGGTLIFGDGAGSAGLVVGVTDGSGAELICPSGVVFAVLADTGSLKNSGGSVQYLSWSSAGLVANFAANNGLGIWDTNSSHVLRIAVGSNLTSNRTFTLTTGNADRTLDISAGSVTITAAGNTLTSAANLAAQQATLGIGQAWTTWSPSWTNLTVGNGTLTAFYTQIGKTVIGRLCLVFGSTTSISGAVSVSAPTSLATHAGTATVTQLGDASFLDAGTAQYRGTVTNASATTLGIAVYTVSGASIAIAALSSSAPFSWGTGDELHITFTYEAA